MTLHVDVPILGETALADRVARDRPVLVLFYADWCPFCAAFVPVFNGHAGELPVPAVAANISHPEDPRWETHAIETIPTLVLFREGKEVSRLKAAPGVGLDEEALVSFTAELAA